MRETIKTKLVRVPCLQMLKRKGNIPDIFNHKGYKMQVRHPGMFLLNHENALFILQDATVLKVMTHFAVCFYFSARLNRCVSLLPDLFTMGNIQGPIIMAIFTWGKLLVFRKTGSTAA